MLKLVFQLKKQNGHETGWWKGETTTVIWFKFYFGFGQGNFIPLSRATSVSSLKQIYSQHLES